MSASQKKYSFFAERAKTLGVAVLLGVLAACSGTATDSGGGTTPPPTASASVAKISVLTVSDTTSNTPKSTVNSDNSDQVTLVATALDANNVAVPDAVVSFASVKGELLTQSSKTDSSGKIVAIFRAGSGNENKANRTENVTLKTSSGVTAIAPIKVSGTVLTAKLAQGSSNNIYGGGTTTLTFLLKDSGGGVISNQAITLSGTGVGAVTFPNATVSTDQNGQATAVVSGQSSGKVTVKAAALGAEASLDLTVASGASAFGIVSPANNTLVGVNVQQQVVVNAPGATEVVFAVTQGQWKENGSSVYVATVANGQAVATFVASKAGVATVDTYNKGNTSERATLALSIGATNASNGRVVLQASPSTIPVSNADNKNSTTLIARVLNQSGDPVVDAPVSFSVTKPSGTGESVGPAVVFSDAAGYAKTTFVAGTAVGKVTVAATVIGASPITVGETTVDVGGQAVSVGLGSDSTIEVKPGDANYYLAMTVFVTDTQGNPVSGAQVNLSVQPIYFSRGGGCAIETATISSVDYTVSYVTENVAEADYLSTLGLAPSSGGKWSALSGSTYVRESSLDLIDKYATSIQPSSAIVGAVPATVTTGADGKVAFTYVYPKSSAIWHVVRVRARTAVAGTEAINDKVFRLQAVKEDVTPDCRLPASPYN